MSWSPWAYTNAARRSLAQRKSAQKVGGHFCNNDIQLELMPTKTRNTMPCNALVVIPSKYCMFKPSGGRMLTWSSVSQRKQRPESVSVANNKLPAHPTPMAANGSHPTSHSLKQQYGRHLFYLYGQTTHGNNVAW